MSLAKTTFRPLTPLLLQGMFEHYKPSAPWLQAGPNFRAFLGESLKGGAQWLVDEKMLREHLLESAHHTFCVKAKNRLAPVPDFEQGTLEARAREILNQSLYGIANVHEHYVGNWRHPVNNMERQAAAEGGDEDRYYCPSPNPTSSRLDALIPVVNRFWSDIPAYLVDEVNRHLVQREEFTQRGWGGNSEFTLAVVDAGACFHMLEAADRLTPRPGPNLEEIFKVPTRPSPVAARKPKP